MEPQNSVYNTPYRINPKLILVILAVIMVLSIVAALLLWVRYPNRSLSETPLHADRNFSYLKGDNIYAYNGMSFYKINTASNNEVTVLSSGLKLPTPSAVFWADDRGALMSFSSSFILTEVEEKLQDSGEFVDELTENYTWYVDFADSSLHLVSEEPIKPKSAYYAADKNTFYYIPDFTGVETDNFLAPDSPLASYSVESKNGKLLVKDMGVVDVTHIGPCPDSSMVVCLVARDKTDVAKVKVIGIDSNNKQTTLLEHRSNVFPTNSPSLYVTLEDTGTERGADDPGIGDHGATPERDTDFSISPTKLHDLKAKTTTDLAMRIAGEDIYPYFITEKEYYAITNKAAADGESNTYIAAAPSTIGAANATELPLKFDVNKFYNAGIRGVAGYGNNGVSLVTTVGGIQLLFSPGDVSKTITPQKKDDVQKSVDLCKANGVVDYFEDVKQFRVLFTDDDSFKQSIATFANCMIRADKKALVGYNFSFGARDPINGRITTD